MSRYLLLTRRENVASWERKRLGTKLQICSHIEGAKDWLVGCAFVIIFNLNGTYSWNVQYFAFTLGLFLCQSLFKRQHSAHCKVSE
jgi:hypothetical protein